MLGIKIKDTRQSNGSRFLSFDLRDILAVIGEPILKSRCRCRDLCYTANIDEEASEIREARLNLTDEELIQLSSRIHQTIDGRFEGRGEGVAKKPWLIIVAFDSSWFEVWSSKPAILEMVRKHFKKVSDIPGNINETVTR